jgi:hypothetical protein
MTEVIAGCRKCKTRKQDKQTAENKAHSVSSMAFMVR